MSDADPPVPATIRDLLSYRVHRLAGALSRGAALRYRAEFGVTLMEWRALALLGDFAPMTLQGLALQAGLDKSQVSRVVSGLVTRGLVRRTVGREDGRQVRLSLSPTGRTLQAGLMRSARARDAVFAAALTAAERRMLDDVIDRLLDTAKREADPKAWQPAPQAPRTRSISAAASSGGSSPRQATWPSGRDSTRRRE